MSIAFEAVISGILDIKNLATRAAPKLSGSAHIIQQILSLSSFTTEQKVSQSWLNPCVKSGVYCDINSLYLANGYDRSLNCKSLSRLVSM